MRQYAATSSRRTQDYLNTRLRYVQRQIRSGSLAGEHEFPALAQARSWRGARACRRPSASEPDRREYTYGAPATRTATGARPDLQRRGREFGDLDEDGERPRREGHGARRPGPLGRTSKVEFGGSYQDRDRVSTYRRFGFSRRSSYGTATPPESIYAGGAVGQPDSRRRR